MAIRISEKPRSHSKTVCSLIIDNLIRTRSSTKPTSAKTIEYNNSVATSTILANMVDNRSKLGPVISMKH